MSARQSAFLAVLLFFGSAAPTWAGDVPGAKSTDAPKLDAFGDPLPPGAYARLGTIRLRHDAKAVAFLDDKTIVSVGSNIRFWDAATGRLIREHRQEKMAQPIGAAISANGKRAIEISKSNEIRVWDIQSGGLVREFDCGSLNVPQQRGEIAVSADGTCFLTKDADPDAVTFPPIPCTRVWKTDAPNGPVVLTRAENPSAFDISPDGKQVATVIPIYLGNSKKKLSLVLWDTVSGRRLRDYDLTLDRINRIQFVRRGSALAIVGADGLELISLDGKVLWRSAKDLGIEDFACATPDRLVAGRYRSDEGSEVFILDSGTGKVLLSWIWKNAPGATVAAPSPDGKRMAVAGDSRLWVIDLSDGKETVDAPGHDRPVNTMAIGLEGRSFASISFADREVVYWDIATGRQARRFPLPSEGAKALAVSSDGKLLACAFSGGIRIWETATGREVVAMNEVRETPTLDFLGDSERLAVANSPSSGTESVAVYQIPSGKIIHYSLALDSYILANLFHRMDNRPLGIYSRFVIGQIMAASNDDVIYELDVWDILAGRVVRRLEGVPKGRVSCAVSKDSRMVAARSHDGTIRLWELASGGPRLTMKEREKLPHADPWGKPLAFSPNGRTIATIINGKPGVDLWDLPSGKQFGSLLGHDLAVTAITFTPDGRRLLTGSEDTTILGWDLTRPARGLRSLSSNLTEKDLATHWGRLRSGSAEEAYRSEWALVGDPRKTVDFLAKQIRPSPTIRPEQVRSWIADLDSDQYEVRERAQGELQRHFDQTEAMLRKAVAGNVSAEVRSRINRIIDASFPAIPEPDQLRELRAIEVLEQIGTTEARDLLRRLAKSDVPTAISRDAAQSLKRLEKCSQ